MQYTMKHHRLLLYFHSSCCKSDDIMVLFFAFSEQIKEGMFISFHCRNILCCLSSCRLYMQSSQSVLILCWTKFRKLSLGVSRYFHFSDSLAMAILQGLS